MRKKMIFGRRALAATMALSLAMSLVPAGPVGAFADEGLGNDGAPDYSTVEVPLGDGVGNRVILKAESDEVSEAIEDAGGEIVGKMGDVYVVEYADEQQAARAADELEQLCEYAEVDQEVVAAADEAVPMGPLAPGALSAGATKVALVDSGAPASPVVVKGLSVIGDDPVDESGHATEMLNSMLEFAGEMKVVSVRVLDGSNKGSIASLYAGIMAAIDEDADVINLSLVTKASEQSRAIAEAIAKAVEAGITVVAAAGNAGSDAAGYMPAGAQGVITVGSCDSEGVRLSNSNFGECVDVYAVSSSTSYAAAMVTGWLVANRAEDGSFPAVEQMAEADGRFVVSAADSPSVEGGEPDEGDVEAATNIATVTSTELRHEDANGNLVNRMNSAVPSYDISFDGLGSCLDINGASIVGSSALAKSSGSYLHSDTIKLNGNVVPRNGLWLSVPDKPSGSSTKEVTGPSGGNIASITFPNVAKHKNGARLDFTVVIKSATLRYPDNWNSATGKPPKMLLCATPNETFTLYAMPATVNVGGEELFPGQMAARVNAECYFTPQGSGADGAKQTGTKLFSAYDLDVGDYWAEGGYYNQNANATWCESIRLVHGYESTVYAQKDVCMLDFSKKEQGWIRSTGVPTLSNTQWPTGFVARKNADSTYMSFTWVGRNCGTKFFEEYEAIKILDRNDAAQANVTDQGVIRKNVSNAGTPLDSVRQPRTSTENRTTKLPWRGSAQYQYTAKPGFKVTKVSVKGLSNNATTNITNATAAAVGSTFTDTGAAGTHMTKQDYQIVVTTAAVPDVTATFTAKKALEGKALRNGQFTFRFYTNDQCAESERLTIDKTTGYVVPVGSDNAETVEGKNDENGNVSIPAVKYRFSGNPADYPKTSTYYVKEVDRTDPQIVYDDVVRTVVVTETYSESEGFKVSTTGADMQFNNTYTLKTAGVKATKVSSASGNPPVAGVTFGVYKTSANDYSTIKRGTPVKTMTTGADGVAQLAGTALAADGSAYRVIETGVPAGFALNTEWVGMFTASEDEADKKIYDVGTVTNTPMGGLQIKKADKDTGAALSGAEFSVYLASGLGNAPSYEDVRAQGTFLMSLTTGADGMAQVQDRLAADGKTYYVIETNPPAGYDLNKSWAKSFTLSTPGQMADFATEGSWCEDKRITLPITGGAGITVLGTVGFALAMTGVLMRRRRDVA